MDTTEKRGSSSFTVIVMLFSFIILGIIIVVSTNNYIVSTTKYESLHREWYPWLESDYNQSIWDPQDVKCEVQKGRIPQTTKNLKLKLKGNHSQQDITILFRLIQLRSPDTPKILDEEYRYVYGPPFRELWSVKLPSDYPAEYRIGVVAYDQEGDLIHGQVETISVPNLEIDAELSVDPQVVTTEEKIKLVIENHGQSSLSFGVSYLLEKYENGIWEEEPSQLMWILIGYGLEPSGTHNQKIDVSRLESGSYRVSKQVDAYGRFLEETLIAEFTIERPPEYIFPEPPDRISFDFSWSWSRDRPVMEIWNMDYRDLYINNTYIIEVLENEKWVHYYTNHSTEIDVVKWGKFWEQRISTPELPVGKYRVFFQIGVEDSQEIKTVIKPFTIQPPKQPKPRPHPH